MTRLTVDAYFMTLARVIALRSTCVRRRVGCVLVDAHHHVLATGYNGVGRGRPHCNHETVELVRDDFKGRDFPEHSYPHACEGAFATSGDRLEGCEAVHAEQNALLQCQDVEAIVSCYTTTSPCVFCRRLLENTACRRLVFMMPYATDHLAALKQVWVDELGRELIHLPVELLPDKL